MEITADASALRGYITPALLVMVVVLVCRYLLVPKLDAREPPLVRGKIPIFGHVIGMIWHQVGYFDLLMKKHPLPAFTIDVGLSKMYVITEPSLVQAGLRSKNLAFEPFIEMVCERILGLSEESMRLIKYEAKNDKEDTYMKSVHKAMHESMTPGDSLLGMNQRVLDKLATFVNAIGPQWEEKRLYDWVRHSFTLSSTRSLYGKHDPISADESLIESLWDFEAGQLVLLPNFLPWLIARKAYKGRSRLQAAFRTYYNSGHDSDAGGLVAQRAVAARKFGIGNNDLADFEPSIAFVSVTNAVPTIFWMLAYVLADPKLVAELRDEVTPRVEITTENIDGKVVRVGSIKMTNISTECPLLMSAYNETMRIANGQVSARVVKEDTILTRSSSGPYPSSYLLKKGTAVQLPARIIHLASTTWGSDSHAFDAKRFLNVGKDNLDKDVIKAQKQSFVPFGGGKHLCPGRFLALAEILGMVAVFVAGFEVVEKDKDAKDGFRMFRTPKPTQHLFGQGVVKPAFDPEVLVRRKEELKDVEWRFVFEEGKIDEKQES
ncbi:cytochrome P450 [Xylogone sp. PMI_703]|nr:cytochrome P450 [Xylogone sp. PMI_703]